MTPVLQVVQEAAWSLPEPLRSEALDGVARIARETRRRSAARSRITPTGLSRRRPEQYHRVVDGDDGRLEQDEDESLTEADRHLEQELRRIKVAESLLGTCRAARSPHRPGVRVT